MNKKKCLLINHKKCDLPYLQKKLTNFKNKKGSGDPQPNLHKIKNLQNQPHFRKKTIEKYDIMKQHLSKILSHTNSVQLSKTLFNNISRESTTAAISTHAKSRCKSRKSQHKSQICHAKTAQKAQLKEIMQQYNSQIIEKAFTLFDTQISNDNKGLQKKQDDQIVQIKNEQFFDQEDELIKMIKTQRLNFCYQSEYKRKLEHAATKIQKFWRLYRTRKIVGQYTKLLNNLFKAKSFESDISLKSVQSFVISEQFKQVNKKNLSGDSLQSNSFKEYNQNILIKSSVIILENNLMQLNQVQDYKQDSKQQNRWIDQNFYKQSVIIASQSSDKEDIINQSGIETQKNYIKTESEGEKILIKQIIFSPLRNIEGQSVSNMDSMEYIINEFNQSKSYQEIEKQKQQQKKQKKLLKQKPFSPLQQLEKLKIEFIQQKQKIMKQIHQDIKSPVISTRIKILNQTKNQVRIKHTYRYCKKNSKKRVLEKEQIFIPNQEFIKESKCYTQLIKQQNQKKQNQKKLKEVSEQYKQQSLLVRGPNKYLRTFNTQIFLNQYSTQLIKILIQQVIQEYKNCNRLKNQINQFLKKEDILILRGINVEANNSMNFVNKIINLAFSQNIVIFNDMQSSKRPCQLQIFKMIRNNSWKNFEIPLEKIIPQSIFEQFQHIISKNLILQKEYENPILQAKRIKLIKKLINIHNRAIFDAFNQNLNKYRKIYHKDPFYRNPILLLRDNNQYYKSQNRIQSAKEEISRILQSRCGIHEQKLYNNFGIESKDYLASLRQDRLNRMVLQYAQNLEQQFKISEIELLKIKMDITDMVQRKLIIEIILEIIQIDG